MATVVRAPFYVPKPPDDPTWYAAPRPVGAINLTRTQLKQFGQPGQAPTKNWTPYFILDDASVWYAAPIPTNAIRATLTQLKQFEQNGQVTAKNWNAAYTQDDASVWNAEPDPSLIISILTNKQIYGQGGQVPTKNWIQLDLWDDASVWYAHSIGYPVISYLTSQRVFGAGGQVPAKSWVSGYVDDAAFWEGAPEPSSVVPLLTQQRFYGAGGQAPAKQWHYEYDDASAWQFKAPHNGTLSKVIAPFAPVFWLFNNDDASTWNAQPDASASIVLTTTQVKFYGQPGQAPTKQWHYEYDDASAWQFLVPHNSNLSVAQAALRPSFWQFNVDDAAPWLAEPNGLEIIQELTAQRFFGTGGQVSSKNWVQPYTIDDPAVWSGAPTKDALLLPLLTAAGQVKNKQWLFGYDDASTWNAAPLRVSSLQVNLTTQKIYGAGGQTPTKTWHYDNDDAAVWWDWIFKNIPITTAGNKPLTAPAPQFVLSADEAWYYTWQRNLETSTVVLPPFKLRPPKLDADDPAVWQFKFNLAIAPTAYTVRANFAFAEYAYDDSRAWQFIFHKPLATTSLQVRAQLTFTYYDEAATYYTLKPSTVVLSAKAPSARQMRDFGLTGEEPWSPTLQAIVNKFLPTTRTTPFPSGKWSQDIPADTPPVMSSIPTRLFRLIQLAFVPSSRFATAPAETRSAKALAEGRSADALTMARSVDVPTDERSADASEGARSVNAPPHT